MNQPADQDQLSRVAVGRIRQALRPTTMSEWAQTKGYQPGTVSVVWYRWGWRAEQTPHGGIARQIMGDLLTDYPALRQQLKPAALRRDIPTRQAA